MQIYYNVLCIRIEFGNKNWTTWSENQNTEYSCQIKTIAVKTRTKLRIFEEKLFNICKLFVNLFAQNNLWLCYYGQVN